MKNLLLAALLMASFSLSASTVKDFFVNSPVKSKVDTGCAKKYETAINNSVKTRKKALIALGATAGLTTPVTAPIIAVQDYRYQTYKTALRLIEDAYLGRTSDKYSMFSTWKASKKLKISASEIHRIVRSLNSVHAFCPLKNNGKVKVLTFKKMLKLIKESK